jgi:hypothetical protein
MANLHAISIQLDAGLFDGVDDAHQYDVGASLRHLAIQTDDALSARYPDTLVSVTWDARTSGRTRCNVTDSEGAHVDPCERDDVRELCERVWEGWTWAVVANGGAL